MFSRRLLITLFLVFASAIAIYFVVVHLLDRLWGNIPIVFYGQLLDQDEKPIDGATVEGYVHAQRRFAIPLMMGDGTEANWDVSEKTDARGYFTVHGGHGKSLHLMSIRESNYIGFCGRDVYYNTTGTGRAPYRSDPKHPEVFHVWRRRGEEHHGEMYIQFDSKSDGRAYILDLVSREGYENANHPGDLRVTVTKADGQTTFRMEAISGGFVPHDGPFPYEAPADGYVPSLTYTFGPANTTGDLKGHFYLKSRDGHVHAVFMISAGRNSHQISMRYRLNTTGSRVLEP